MRGCAEGVSISMRAVDGKILSAGEKDSGVVHPRTCGGVRADRRRQGRRRIVHDCSQAQQVGTTERIQ